MIENSGKNKNMDSLIDKLGKVNSLDQTSIPIINIFRKKTRKSSSTNKLFYKIIFDISPESILVLDHEGKIIDANQNTFQSLGFTKEEIVLRNINDLEEHSSLTLDYIKQIWNCTEHDEVNYEAILKRKDGPGVHVFIHLRFIKAKKYKYVIAFAKDITLRKDTEKELQKTLSKYKLLFNNTGTRNLFWDKNGNLSDYNDEFGEYYNSYFQYLKETNQKPNETELYKEFKSNIDKCAKYQKKMDIATSFTHKGSTVFAESSYVPVFDENNNFAGIQIISKDVTAQKTLENSLKASEERYKLLSNASKEGIVIHDNGVLYDTNKAFVKIFGYDPKELRNMNAIPLLFPKNSQKIITEKIKTEDTNPYVVEAIRKDQKHIWIELEARNIIYQGKKLRLALLRDITEKKAKDDLILESQRRYKQLTELSQEGILIHKNGIAVDINPAAEKIVEANRDRIIGQKVINLAANEETFTKFKNSMKKNISEPYEADIKTFKGRHKTVRISAYLLSEKNQLRVATIQDITLQKENERKIMNAIIEAEEHERSYFSLELHDGLGPVLSSINMYFDWLSHANDESERELILKNGKQNIDEAINIVEEISNKLTPRTLNAFGVTAATETFISRLHINENIKFNFKSNLEKRLITHLEAALYRIITELINNSLKHANANYIEINLAYNSDEKILLANFIDNGIGFNYKETIKKNKGLGLVNIIERVKTYNGDIKYTTSPNKGVNVEIKFKDI